MPLHKEGGHQTGFPGSPPTHQHREATLGTLIKRCAIFSSASVITDGLHTTTCGASSILNGAVRKFWERWGWATESRCCRGVGAHRVEGIVGNIIHYRIETNKLLFLIILLTLTFIFEPGRVSHDVTGRSFQSHSSGRIVFLCGRRYIQTFKPPPIESQSSQLPISPIGLVKGGFCFLRGALTNNWSGWKTCFFCHLTMEFGKTQWQIFFLV